MLLIYSNMSRKGKPCFTTSSMPSHANVIITSKKFDHGNLNTKESRRIDGGSLIS